MCHSAQRNLGPKALIFNDMREGCALGFRLRGMTTPGGNLKIGKIESIEKSASGPARVDVSASLRHDKERRRA
jgi:hypothetical protein